MSIATLVAIGAVMVLVALGITDQVIPAADPHTSDVRPWVAARALGVAAYLLLAGQVALGLLLSHPRNTSEWRKSKQIFPWHELVTVFVTAFVALHVALLAVDPYANVGWVGALVPGMSGFRTPAVAIGSISMYALLFTAITAKWTRLLPAGWWLKAHRFAALTFLLVWVHSVLAGTDGGALTALYLGTGLPILAGVAHRLWSARSRPRRTLPELPPVPSPVRPQPAALVEES
ncbi:MAG: hypothetical protein WCK58_04400 [Chloroflexota bacterium]